MNILDTDVISNLRKRRPDPGVAAWLAAVDPASLRITAATVSEVCYGIHLARQSDPSSAGPLEAWFAAMLASSTVLPLDTGPARILGEMWATASLRQRTTAAPGARRIQTGGDLVIAAIALHHDATVVTGNTADFAAIAAHFARLRVVNPFNRAQ